eukprot:366157-Chlamydomonas_euryale.AAC.3
MSNGVCGAMSNGVRGAMPNGVCGAMLNGVCGAMPNGVDRPMRGPCGPMRGPCGCGAHAGASAAAHANDCMRTGASAAAHAHDRMHTGALAAHAHDRMRMGAGSRKAPQAAHAAHACSCNKAHGQSQMARLGHTCAVVAVLGALPVLLAMRRPVFHCMRRAALSLFV